MTTTEELYARFKECTGLCTDTRKIEPGCMFVALKGDKFNANTFARNALEAGAKYAVIDEQEYDAQGTLLVNDGLTALQDLARHHRRQLGLPIVALTGSNGKTTTKELIRAVLSEKYNVTATVGNLNNHIGVPLTLLSFTEATEIGIVEMGANHQKEIEFLCSIAEPNFGYITNFGKAHLEGFGGIEGVIKGKSEMYAYLAAHTKMAFVNLDDPIQSERTENLPRYTFSAETRSCDVFIESATATPLVTLQWQGRKIQSNLIGSYNAPNIVAAIAIGHYFKISDDKIIHAIQSYTPNNNRSQLMQKGSNKIILDAYNANPSSMMAAIDNFAGLEGDTKIAVLGDMFELGPESAAEHHKISERLAKLGGITVYFVGKDFSTNAVTAPHLSYFDTFDKFASGFKSPENATILIKGSRGMALERTLDLL